MSQATTQELLKNFAENLSEKPVMSQRKHRRIVLVQAWFGWVCNFRIQIPHLELSTVQLLIGCLYFHFNTTTERRDLPWGGEWSLVLASAWRRGPCLEQEISCRDDSGEKNLLSNGKMHCQCERKR